MRVKRGRESRGRWRGAARTLRARPRRATGPRSDTASTPVREGGLSARIGGKSCGGVLDAGRGEGRVARGDGVDSPVQGSAVWASGVGQGRGAARIPPTALPPATSAVIPALPPRSYPPFLRGHTRPSSAVIPALPPRSYPPFLRGHNRPSSAVIPALPPRSYRFSHLQATVGGGRAVESGGRAREGGRGQTKKGRAGGGRREGAGMGGRDGRDGTAGRVLHGAGRTGPWKGGGG